ncbi:MAG: GNAT family N-acetyltransferase [Chloroflexia bacterium]
MLFLTPPSVEFKDSYIQAMREYHAEDRYLYIAIPDLLADFEGHVREALSRADPQNVPPGRVPDTQLWLIDDCEFIGRVSIRHEIESNDWLRRFGGHIGYDIRPTKRRMGYGVKQLALALPYARALGLSEVLITCDEDNIGSRKIIEQNGGRFERAVKVPGEPTKLRYWIHLPRPAG